MTLTTSQKNNSNRYRAFVLVDKEWIEVFVAVWQMDGYYRHSMFKYEILKKWDQSSWQYLTTNKFGFYFPEMHKYDRNWKIEISQVKNQTIFSQYIDDFQIIDMKIFEELNGIFSKI